MNETFESNKHLLHVINNINIYNLLNKYLYTFIYYIYYIFNKYINKVVFSFPIIETTGLSRAPFYVLLLNHKVYLVVSQKAIYLNSLAGK